MSVYRLCLIDFEEEAESLFGRHNFVHGDYNRGCKTHLSGDPICIYCYINSRPIFIL